MHPDYTFFPQIGVYGGFLPPQFELDSGLESRASRNTGLFACILVEEQPSSMAFTVFRERVDGAYYTAKVHANRNRPVVILGENGGRNRIESQGKWLREHHYRRPWFRRLAEALSSQESSVPEVAKREYRGVVKESIGTLYESYLDQEAHPGVNPQVLMLAQAHSMAHLLRMYQSSTPLRLRHILATNDAVEHDKKYAKELGRLVKYQRRILAEHVPRGKFKYTKMVRSLLQGSTIQRDYLKSGLRKLARAQGSLADYDGSFEEYEVFPKERHAIVDLIHLIQEAREAREL